MCRDVAGKHHKHQWTIKLAVLCTVVFSPWIAEASQNEPGSAPESIDEDKLEIEYFAVRLGGGLYGGGGEVTLFTLRWPFIYWEILRSGIYLGGPSQLGDDDYRVMFFLGTGVGYPLCLDESKRHELRFGILPAFSVMSGGDKEIPCPNRSVCRYDEESAFWVGFAIGPDISYVWHIKNRIAFQFGISALFAVYPQHLSSSENEDSIFWQNTKFRYPTPSPVGYVGLRF